MKLNKEKLDKYDFGAAYHQAWHESNEFDENDGHPTIRLKDIPKEYKGKIPENIFKFILSLQDWVKEDIIKECCEDD